MVELEGVLRELVGESGEAEAVASVSVISRGGGEPQTAWVPAGDDEPAFLVYSVTKTFVAALVLLLCEEGTLALDAPLARWYREVEGADRISLRQLLNHTAGIPNYGGKPAYHEGVRRSPGVPWSFERFAAETFGRGLAFEPGAGWAYSNPGYMLVKRVLEEAGGASFRELVRGRITAPLGLERTFVAETQGDLASLAPAFSTQLAPDGAPRDVRSHYHPGWVSHGVIASTASDIVRFLDALFGARVLSRAALQEMLRLVLVGDGGPGPEPDSPLRPGRPSYGLGVMGDPASPWGLLVGHNGGGPGYGASAFHAAALGASVCCLVGTERVNPEAGLRLGLGLGKG